MTTQTKKKQVEQLKKESKCLAKIKSELRVSCLGSATSTIKRIFHNEELDLATLLESLGKQQNDVIGGETTYIERMLLSQAQTLQALFHFAAERIAHCENLNQMQLYSELAFKANNGTRKTLLALNQIQNPSPSTFIRQQNNAFNQQINQGEISNQNSEKKPENELLSEVKNEALEYRRPFEAISAYPKMETLAEINRC